MWQGIRVRSHRSARRKWIFVAGLLGLAAVASAAIIPNLFPFLDPTGLISTYNTAGPIDQSGPFFQSLGTNGRSCSTCHLASDAMGLSVQSIRTKFATSHGKDPLFAAIDGANCPSDTSRDASAHSLLLKNGLIRVAMTVPPTAQFKIQAYRDPYGCAVVTDPDTGAQTVSVYRRPLPTTNLRFLSAIMFDGRETLQPLTSTNNTVFQANLVTDLLDQAVNATLTHAQATEPPTPAQQNAIVKFELGFSSAQTYDFRAGWLNHGGATAGPLALSSQSYYPGENDSLGADPDGKPFNSTGMTLFSAWENAGNSRNGNDDDDRDHDHAEARRKIAAGEKLFNTRALTISNVRGLTDNAALAKALGTTVPIAPFQGFCTTCHDTPNIGNHSLPLALDIGTGHDPSVETDPLIANGVSQLSFPDLPIYEITGCPNPFADPAQPSEPYVILTTDPGKGLVSGLCSDVSRTKGPVLRGLAARAPYFHNGAAANLSELLDFYNLRFQMNLTPQEKSELIAFLNSL
jgi:cytochrome c peroxidase